ncbi:MAG: YwiC-like family protein [Spirochaetota bacterium]|nr:YwiC-like family protein [Spirochaetota bacterium]
MIKAPIPKEHGMWVIFIIPVLIASIAALKLNIPMSLLFISAFFLFLWRHTTVQLVKNWQKHEKISKELIIWNIIYLIICITLFLPLVLFYKYYKLYYFIGLSMFFLLLNILQVWQKKDRDILNQVLGIIALTLIGPGIYYVLMDTMNLFIGYALWIGSSLYFIGTIFSVKSRTTGNPYNIISFIYYICVICVVFILSIIFRFSWIVVLAFVPIGLKSLYYCLISFKKVNIRIIGLTEGLFSIIFAILFGILLIYS